MLNRLPRLRKFGINTTGMTPHRAIPMLHQDRELCDEAAASSSARACRSTASATCTTTCAT
jgi:hypothetical protein